MSDLPRNPLESFKRRNPHLYPDLDRLQNPIRKQDQRRKVEDSKLEKCTPSLAVRVSILSLRRRKVDEHDNLRTGAKPLVDAITASLGLLGDDDPRVEWEYGQVITSGQEGTIVKIERYET